MIIIFAPEKDPNIQIFIDTLFYYYYFLLFSHFNCTGLLFPQEFRSNSPLLKHLGEAGLLSDVSALLSRARSRDESNLRKIQSQAKGKQVIVNLYRC